MNPEIGQKVSLYYSQIARVISKISLFGNDYSHLFLEPGVPDIRVLFNKLRAYRFKLMMKPFFVNSISPKS
jgi:hypothetical protein